MRLRALLPHLSYLSPFSVTLGAEIRSELDVQDIYDGGEQDDHRSPSD